MSGGIYTAEDIQQRAAMMLRDVHYVFEVHFEMTEKANPSDNPGKFQDILIVHGSRAVSHELNATLPNFARPGKNFLPGLEWILGASIGERAVMRPE